MGACLSKADNAAVDKAVDAAVQNKDKVVTGVKSAGAKAGISQSALDSGAKKLDAVLADKEGLKANINKALGNEVAPAAAAAANPSTEAVVAGAVAKETEPAAAPAAALAAELGAKAAAAPDAAEAALAPAVPAAAAPKVESAVAAATDDVKTTAAQWS